MTEPTLADLIHASGLPGGTFVAALRDPGVTSAPVSWHVTKPLTSQGVHTLRQLAVFTDADLLTFTGFGPARLADLKAAVRAAGTETP